MRDPLNAFELFDAALEAFHRGDLGSAVGLLRSALFENLYIAPTLLGDESHPQNIWHSGVEAEPQAARDYAGRQGPRWAADPGAMAFLEAVWNDPFVRAELKRFINLSRNLLHARGGSGRDELLRERQLFRNPERIKRTQSEILARMGRVDLRPPAARPRLGLVMLASRDPAAAVEFYRQLLDVEPASTSRDSGGYAEFEFEGIHLAIHGRSDAAVDDPYLLGPPPAALGWGAVFVFRVADFDRYYGNATAAGLTIVDRDLVSSGRRSFVVKDPSGYLLEITEEDPSGFEMS